MINEQPAWIFFDLGWTLEDELEAQRDRAAQVAKVAEEYGYGLDPSAFTSSCYEAGTRKMGPVFDGALTLMGIRPNDRRAIMDRTSWNKSLLSLYPAALPVLKALHGRFGVGIIANQSAGSPARLEQHGVRHLVSPVITSAEVGVAKPDSRIFELAEQDAALPPERIWMVGDRLDNDIVPAKRRGWRTIRVLQGHHAGAKVEREEEEPDYTIGKIDEILPIFDAVYG